MIQSEEVTYWDRAVLLILKHVLSVAYNQLQDFIIVLNTNFDFAQMIFKIWKEALVSFW